MKKLLFILILLSITVFIVACNDNENSIPNDSGNTTESTQENSSADSNNDIVDNNNNNNNNNNNDDNKSPTAPLLTIVEKGKSDYTLVADEAQGERVISTASSLYNAIKDSTGVALKSNRHGESNEQKEIHLGLTKHPLSVSTYNTLDYDEYSILVIGEKIFIVGGTPSALEAATEEFMNKFANSEEKHIKIPERTDITGKISSLALEKLKSGSWNVFDYGSTNVEYGILLPKNYDATKQYPYFIYVHGHGYGGDNTQGYNWNKFQTYLESLGFLDAEGIRDCIIIAPHLKVNQGKESWWSNSFNVIGYAVTDIPYDTTPPSNNLTDMYTIIRQVGDALNIDENRVYITGASDGGYATWELITRYTDFFTAAIPLCGAADTSKADVIRDLPIFFFHGDADTTVSISAATKIEAALKAAGAKSYNYVALKGLGHGISQAAYSHDGLWDWLFAQTKK